MRNVEKYIEEYYQNFGNGNRGVFTRSDLKQLFERNTTGKDYLFEIMNDCLTFGFMVGYKLGCREKGAKKNERCK